MATTGVLTAAAICMGPVSLPTYIVAAEANAARTGISPSFPNQMLGLALLLLASWTTASTQSTSD